MWHLTRVTWSVSWGFTVISSRHVISYHLRVAWELTTQTLAQSQLGGTINLDFKLWFSKIPGKNNAAVQVNRMTLEIEANATDLETPVLISADRRSLFIPCMVSKTHVLRLSYQDIRIHRRITSLKWYNKAMSHEKWESYVHDVQIMALAVFFFSNSRARPYMFC